MRIPEVVNVMLIDDDEDDYFFMKDIFEEIESFKAEITWISKYSEAAEALKKPIHDIYLLDYRLGQGTGLELIKTALYSGVTAPLVLMTGYGHQEVDMEAMRVGASDYLVKDQINAPLLERTIRYSINRAKNLQDLQMEKNNFRDLFNSTFEGIFILEGLKILDLNEAAARIYGYQRTDLIGQSFLNLADPKSVVDVEEAMRDHLTTDKEITGFKEDGTRIDLELRAKIHNYSGIEARLVAVRDITTRKQLESQVIVQDRLASLGLMASSLAHEIGTPLGVMRGRAELLSGMLPNDQAASKNLGIIISEIDRISVLIRSLLTLARGGDSKQVTPVQIQEVVRPVIEFLAHEFKTKKIDILNELETQAPLIVWAESSALQQVILNLLMNSVHAIEQKKTTSPDAAHHMRIYADINRDGFVQVGIEDTGTGISAENMRSLFKPFFTTKEIGKGTGLGLATSYRILESWGGGIEVESREGVGATFKLLLKKCR